MQSAPTTEDPDWYADLIRRSSDEFIDNSSREAVQRVFSHARTVIGMHDPKHVEPTLARVTTAATTEVLGHAWFVEALGRTLEAIAERSLHEPPLFSLVLAGRHEPPYALRQKGHPDKWAIQDYRKFKERGSALELPNYPWSNVKYRYDFSRFHRHMTAAVIGLMEIGVELFGQGDIASMPLALQRFGPLIEHEATSREQFANDGRMPFTPGLTEFSFGNEERMRGPAATFSQSAMHYAELVMKKILAGEKSPGTLADVQRKLLDPSGLEIVASYPAAEADNALRLPEDTAVKYEAARRRGDIPADVSEYTASQLEAYGPQPACPVTAVGGKRIRSNSLPALNQNGLRHPCPFGAP